MHVQRWGSGLWLARPPRSRSGQRGSCSKCVKPDRDDHLGRTVVGNKSVPVVVSFSTCGPNCLMPNILKPDLIVLGSIFSWHGWVHWGPLACRVMRWSLNYTPSIFFNVVIDFFCFIWPFVLFKIFVQICNIVSCVWTLFSNKIYNNFNFLK
jgi:hypothetical protein